MSAPDFIMVTEPSGFFRVIPTRSILMVKVHVDGAGPCVQIWFPSPHPGTPPVKLTVMESVEDIARMVDAAFCAGKRLPSVPRK